MSSAAARCGVALSTAKQVGGTRQLRRRGGPCESQVEVLNRMSLHGGLA